MKNPSSKPPASGRTRKVCVLASVSVVVLSLALPATWVEHGFSRGLFPWVQSVLVPLFGYLPFPVMGTLLAMSSVLVPVVVWRRWRNGRRAGLRRRRLIWLGGLSAGRVLVCGYAAFLVLWGFGYHRIPIETRWGLGAAPPSPTQVREFQARIVALLHRDAPPGPEGDEERARRAIAAAAADLVMNQEGFRPRLPAHLKHPPSGLLIAVGIFGIVSPFTLEAHVDPGLPPPFRLAIGGHELAHLLGYCGEADANLVGFVAGLKSDDAYARYSTALGLLRYMLPRRAGAETSWLRRHLPERARRDLADLAAAQSRYRIGAIATMTTKINHGYLRTQGVDHGVADYARGFALLVRAHARGLVDLPPPFLPDQDR